MQQHWTRVHIYYLWHCTCFYDTTLRTLHQLDAISPCTCKLTSNRMHLEVGLHHGLGKATFWQPRFWKYISLTVWMSTQHTSETVFYWTCPLYWVNKMMQNNSFSASMQQLKTTQWDHKTYNILTTNDPTNSLISARLLWRQYCWKYHLKKQ